MDKHSKALIRLIILILLTAALLPLGGCYNYDANEVDRVLYPLLMGIDRAEETGTLTMSVIMPVTHSRVQAGDDSGGGSSGEEGEEEPAKDLRNKTSGYVTSVVEAPTWAEAVSLLNATLPYKLDLSQVQLVVFSQSLAQSDRIYKLITDMVRDQTFHTMAQTAVCQGSAVEYLAGLKVSPGSRLALTLTSMIAHLSGVGIVPSAPLASVFYGMHGLYGTPLAIFTNDKAFASPGRPTSPITDSEPGVQPVLAGIAPEYDGCALFTRHRMVGTLSGYETQLLMILRGDRNVSLKAINHTPVVVRSYSKPKIDIDLSGDSPRINIQLGITVDKVMDQEEADRIAMLTSTDIRALIAKCQSLKVDPFGFIDIVARRFFTYDDLVAYDWLARFEHAEVHVSTRLFTEDDDTTE